MVAILGLLLGGYLLFTGIVGLENYSLLRPIVFFGSVLLCYLVAIQKDIKTHIKNYYIVYLIILIIVFNPIFPIYLYSRGLWVLIDILAGGILIAFTFKISESTEYDDKTRERLERLKTINSKELTKKDNTNGEILKNNEVDLFSITMQHIEENSLVNKLDELMENQNLCINNRIKYNSSEHKDLIEYHLICYLCATLKLFFTHGYSNHPFFTFYQGDLNNLEYQLNVLKNKPNIKKYILKKFVQTANGIEYRNVCNLNEIEPPYILQVNILEDYLKISALFATNLAIIFEPIILKNTGMPYEDFIFSLRKDTDAILDKFIAKRRQ